MVDLRRISIDAYGMTSAPLPTPTLSERVAEEIRAWMGRRRVTGAALAKTLGVSPAWISYRLSGKQPIDLNDLDAIASALKVSPADLLPADLTRRRATSEGKTPAAVRPRDNRPNGHPDRAAATHPTGPDDRHRPIPIRAGTTTRRPRRINPASPPPAAHAA